MRLQTNDSNRIHRPKLIPTLVACVILLFVPISVRAIVWDAGAGTDNWFDPVNWNTNSNSNLVIPPTTDADADPLTPPVYSASDATINFVAGAWDSDGEGVVYDPSPTNQKFVDAATLGYPTGYDRDTIWRLYLGRTASADPQNTGLAKLTIRGDMDTNNTAGDTRWQIGRSSGVANAPVTGFIVQERGIVKNNFGDVDLGSIDTGTALSFGNGTYDYRSGTFENGLTSGRLRLSAGGSSAVGGIGKFIMHNPGTNLGNGGGGHVRVKDLFVAAFGGQNGIEPNGTTTGVGIMEYHYQNGGTRAIQVLNSLTIANGADSDGAGTRSAQLRLVLDQRPTVLAGVPNDLGLIDIDFDKDGAGSLIGPGTGPGGLGLRFSNADAANPLDASAVYQDGGIVTALYHGSTYRWNIFYSGNISWAAGSEDNSILDTNAGGGDGIASSGGRDIVLIGLDSIIVPEGVAGDYNNNGVVDAADYVVWRKNNGLISGATTAQGDGDGDGDVDNNDYTYWRARFGNTSGSGSGLGSASVPEPASASLALVGLLAIALGRRCRPVAA